MTRGGFYLLRSDAGFDRGPPAVAGGRLLDAPPALRLQVRAQPAGNMRDMPLIRLGILAWSVDRDGGL